MRNKWVKYNSINIVEQKENYDIYRFTTKEKDGTFKEVLYKVCKGKFSLYSYEPISVKYF